MPNPLDARHQRYYLSHLWQQLLSAPDTPRLWGGCQGDGCSKPCEAVQELLELVDTALDQWPLEVVDAALAIREQRRRHQRKRTERRYSLPRCADPAS